MKDVYYDHDSVWRDRRKANSPFWGPYSQRLYQQLVAMAKTVCGPSDKVLDLGCGAGAFGLSWQEVGHSYVGADSSKEAIELGRERWQGLDLRVFDGAVESLPHDLCDGFDLVTAVNSLHCLVEEQHRQRFLENARAALPAGRGHFLLTSMCGPPRPGFKASKKPRAYLDPWQIVAEVQAIFGGELKLLQILQPTGRALIPNVYLIMSNA